MAYTLKKEDQDAIAQLSQAWSEAKARGDQAGMNAAHSQAEQIRAGYGFSGGDNGIQQIALPSSSPAKSTYVPLDTSGTDYAGMVNMSDVHRAALDAAQSSWAAAKKAGNQQGMDAAHQQAEAIRALYSYSGGKDGTQYLPFGSENDDLIQRLLAMSQDRAPAYTGSEWDTIKNDLAKAYVADNYDKWAQGDQYDHLADRYRDQGQLAMQDMLAQLSARTGGLASSYAETVAQQQYNNYMAMLEDVARKQYDKDHAELGEKVSAAQGMSKDDYGRYLDSLSQYNTDRNYALNVINGILGYNTQQDETSYNRGQTAMAQAQNRIANHLANGGTWAELSADLISQSGYTTAELERMQAMYQASLAKSAGGGGGSGGGRTGSGNDSGKNYMPSGWNILEAQQIKDEAGGSVLTDKAWNAIKEAYGVGDNDIAAYGFTKVDSNLGYTGPESLLNLYPGNNGNALTDAEKKLLGLKTGGTSTR